MLEIGTIVSYSYRKNLCIVIANKEEPHRYKYGVKEYDDMQLIRIVPDGYDYTIVETSIGFSTYIDVKESEIKAQNEH